MKIIDDVSYELWDDITSRSGNATFYHSSQWARIMHEAFPEWKIAAKGIMFEDGTRSLIPFMARTSVPGIEKGWKSFFSMFPGVYGGIISDRKLTQEKTERIARYLARLTGLFSAEVVFIENPFQRPIPLQTPFNKKDLFTQVLRLDKGYDLIWKNLNHGHKCSIEKARKQGVVVERAKTIEDYRAYFSVYQDTLKRFGDKATMVYNDRLFEAFGKADTTGVTLWLARLENTIIGGTIVVYCNKHASPWHAASLTKYLDFRPNNLIHIVAIQDACERGYLYYDFCPSSGLKGVETFKKRFGAERMDFCMYQWNNSLLKKAQKFKSWLFKTKA